MASIGFPGFPSAAAFSPKARPRARFRKAWGQASEPDGRLASRLVDLHRPDWLASRLVNLHRPVGSRGCDQPQRARPTDE